MPPELAEKIKQAHETIAAVQEAHGFVGVSEMAREWGISRQRVQALTRKAGFPRPIVANKGDHGYPTLKLYLRTEVYEWRRLQLRSAA